MIPSAVFVFRVRLLLLALVLALTATGGEHKSGQVAQVSAGGTDCVMKASPHEQPTVRVAATDCTKRLHPANPS
jgi:hypothetical protein